MNAGELVISLMLKAGQLKAEAARAQSTLDKTGEAGGKAMETVGRAAAKAGADMAQASTAASDLQREFAKALEEGKTIQQVTREYETLRAEMLRTGATREKLEALDAAAKKLGVTVKQTTETAQAGFGALVPKLQAVAGLLGVGLGIKGAVSMYLEQADALGKYADSLGVAAEDVQAWEEATKHAGGSAEGFRASLVALNEKLVDAGKSATGEMAQMFAKLGVGLKDSTGKAKTATDVMLELASAAETMDKGAFVGMARKLGLDQGQIMLLQQGRKAVEAAIKAGKEHIRFTKADTEAAAKANDAIQDMQTSLLALAMRAIAPAIPLLTKFAQGIHRAAQWISENSETVTAFFIAIGAILLRTGIPAMISFATATWAALAPFLPFIAAAAALGLAFDDLWAFITGGNSVLEHFLQKLGVSQETIESVREALRTAAGFFLDLWDAVTGEGVNADAAWQRVKASWEAMQAWFRGLVDRLLAWFGQLFDQVRNWLAGLLPDWLKSMLGGGGDNKGAPAAAGQDDAETRQAYTQQYDAWGTPVTMSGMATPGQLAGQQAAHVDNSRSVEQTTNINSITVQTQATDAQGIARDMGGAIRNQTAQLDGAYGL